MSRFTEYKAFLEAKPGDVSRVVKFFSHFTPTLSDKSDRRRWKLWEK